MKLRGNWEMDREPTKRERVAAILLGLIVCIPMGAMSYFGIVMYINGETALLDYSFFYVLFLLGLWVLVRAIFTRSAKPGAVAIMATGVFLIVVGIFLLVMPSSKHLPHYVVIISILGGSVIFSQGYRKLKKP